MQLATYLTFAGDCRAAFELYANVLGGKIEGLRTHADSPMKAQTPPEWEDKILHVQLAVGSAMLMGSDRPPQYLQAAQGFSVSLVTDSAADAERIFAGLSDGGTVLMPLEKTFWAPRFGTLVDRFGTPWMIQCAST